MEDCEWVLVKEPTDRDIWSPSLKNGEESSSSRPLEIRFNEAAKHWTDALPIGNGRLGAMIWGGVSSEILNLNEDTLWTGTPGDYTNPEAPKSLAEVRKLVDNGQYAEATEAAVQLTDNSPDVYQLLGDIKLEFDDSHGTFQEEKYERVLDLDTATVKVNYSVGDVEFAREYFASNPDQVIAAKVSANKPGYLAFTLSMDSKMHHHTYVSGNNQIIMEGSCPGKRKPPKVDANDNPKGIQFTAILDLQISGGSDNLQVLDNRRFRVEHCDWAIILLVASSSFNGPFIKPADSKRDPKSECSSMLNSIKKFSYSELYARHLDDYQKLFHRVSLQLSKSSDSVAKESGRVSTADRVKSFKTDEDPSLVELLFQYGRYLLIACSRPGTQPANLQGIWNCMLEPPWDCAPHLNINLQMNYWPALSCNLKECQEPLYDYTTSLSLSGCKTAKYITGELRSIRLGCSSSV